MARAMILVAALALAACASAQDEPTMTAPPAAAAAPTAAPAPASAAQNGSETMQTTPRSGSAADDDTVVVPGQVTRQLPTPDDPRSTTQRMADIRAYDECVMRMQGRAEDANRPQLETPEDVCARSTGMSERTAVPAGRR